MTPEAFAQSQFSAALPDALQALWHDRQGDWQKAHNIIQDAEDRNSAWVHAYLHRKEGDPNNARYWYRRAGQPFFEGTIEQEWEAIVQTLLKQTP